MQFQRANASDTGIAIALAVALVSYASIRVIEAIELRVPNLLIVAVNVLSALAFALVHGGLHYRLRGILVFTAICLVVGNVTENLGVATGFPFGQYHFAGLMGPMLFHVPVFLGLAYVGMSYISWSLARLIVGSPLLPLTGRRLLAVPLVGSFIMVAWDMAQDPVWATILHGWVWVNGGPWFGVPISNFLGWFLNIFVIFLLFALYLRRQKPPEVPWERGNWRSALIFYVLCAIGNVLQLNHHVPEFVADPTGRQWRVEAITGASALVSIFVMGAFAAIAWIRLVEQEQATKD
jgi:putative membrane protein